MLTKERVFQIMGKYYGNAHYRSAIALGIPEEDLMLTAKILDEINALGYYFSNLHALKSTADQRFVPIILRYYPHFISPNYNTGLIYTLSSPAYKDFVPELLAIYEETTSPQVREDVSQVLLGIRSKKYVSEYLRIINKPDYGVNQDYMVYLLCTLRVKEVLPKLLELLEQNPHGWRWTFLKYAAVSNEPSLLPIIEPYLESDDSELRLLARKAIKKLSDRL